MNILIVEDEHHAVKRLVNLIQQIRPKANILISIDTVEDTVEWLTNHPAPDLAFFDIQLADGLSFDIFTKVNVTHPIIFTTAFDEYAIRAFKVNSVDYLLKPIQEEELAHAFQKFEQLYQHQPAQYDVQSIQQMLKNIIQKEYTERFLVKVGQQMTHIDVAQIAYFFSENSLTFLKTFSTQKHLLDYTLDQIEEMLRPKLFFRINRKVIIHVNAIERVAPYFNNRLALQINPKSAIDLIVSRHRVKDFKRWLGA
jgi:DNA-binding LytR/AlgR family response regulator